MKLSIIIPVYNAEKYLKQCLNSVLEQIQGETEVIIVNDGSTDSSVDICKEYAEKYSCIKLINKINEGVSKARNVAIEQAEGEWITFLDADDMLQKDSLISLKSLECDADVIICDYSIEYVNNKNKEINGNLLPKELMMKGILNLPSYANMIKHYNYNIDGFNNWTCWGKFFKAQVIKENNIEFPETITHGEDLLFCYQFYLHASKIYYNSVCLYFYRINDQSVSHSFNAKRITNTLRMLEYFIKIDQQINDSEDFRYFVVDRIIACCKLYFANKKNVMTKDEKVKELKELSQISFVNKAIMNCPLKKLSLGKKTNIINIFILFLLKNKMYRQAILISKI